MASEPRLAHSQLEDHRRFFKPRLPSTLAGSFKTVVGEARGAMGDKEKIQALFPKTYGKPTLSFEAADEDEVPARPLRVGVVLSGGQAPGGHNVIAGIFDFIKRFHADSVMVGFKNGPHGIFTGNYLEIDDELMDKYRNMGGFDIIGSGRHKIHDDKQFADSLRFCTELRLDGLVVIGGDDSNTNGAVLAEYFAEKGSMTSVVGAPKTIDGDLKVQPFIPVSFGFDTACRTYAELIGNVAADAASSQKYYHFVRLMGRSASHITLEAAFQTQPNLTFVGEEVQEKQQSLAHVTQQVVDLIVERAAVGKDYGVVLVPEGLIEFIPDVGALIGDINEILAPGDVAPTIEAVGAKLAPANKACFDFLPLEIKLQLLADRDAHGNVAVSKIETERLLTVCAEAELAKLKAAGKFAGTFSPQFHFFGYEGRSCLPSQFDANYCYALGYTAGALISRKENGHIASITNLLAPVEEWVAGGCPTTMLMNIERRIGAEKPVIKKALTELDGRPFQVFCEKRARWRIEDHYRNPGPIQFEGPGSSAICFHLQYELEGAAAAAAPPAAKKARK
jgi:diphosphate--fructose-6-phosphate 1-phosphotransferase